MKREVTGDEILAKLKSVFYLLRKVDDKLESITNLAPRQQGFSVSEQARKDLQEAITELNCISDYLSK